MDMFAEFITVLPVTLAGVRPLALYVHLVGHSRCFTVGGCDVYMYGAGRDEEEFSDALVRLSAG